MQFRCPIQRARALPRRELVNLNIKSQRTGFNSFRYGRNERAQRLYLGLDLALGPLQPAQNQQKNFPLSSQSETPNR